MHTNSHFHLLVTALAIFTLTPSVLAQDAVRIAVQTGKTKQTFEGLGAGVMFYEGHITSFTARKNETKQEELFDDLFGKVRTQYLLLMIRETHEPQNDNNDPQKPAFDDKNFDYCQHTLQIAKAALKRQPNIELVGSILTPPSWMKTNNDPSGGGDTRATLKDGLEQEYAEYLWAFLEYMQRGGAPIKYLAIANEPDWPHTQPGCAFTPERYAALLKTVGDYLDKMAKKYPKVARPKLIGPNTLSAPGAAKDYLPLILKKATRHLDVIGSHDYDQRGDRWGALKKLGGTRPVWMTEWAARDKDTSSEMINSATDYAAAMHDAFQGGVNVWLAYDWIYPPRDSGEALIHIDWGNGYKLTKPYHVFRQWAEPLRPGMKVVETITAGKPGMDKPAILATAFVDTEKDILVIHAVNVTDREAKLMLKLGGKFAKSTTVSRTRTSSTEDAASLDAIEPAADILSDSLPARSLVTYRIELRAK